MRVVVLTVLMLSIFSIGAYAQTNEDTVVEEYRTGTILFRSVNSSDDLLPLIIDNITEKPTYISLTTSSYASQTVDELKTDIYVQKLVNGNWVELKKYTFTEYNTSSMTKIVSHYGIDSSDTHRAIFNHYATHEGVTHMKQHITSAH
ncbi:hypothetical protein HZI73_04840 [Vallitalea pronyensis]|uniref:Uncharacterized protein n=1 Tax=Vallitalea pronyensis TaxID=1348613 RepID=A0A8J8MHD7_9FIRM|nr:hypothetical protein [Vallitalea pronyensis]QUI21660.1 hypothetical protein HZI73_04840 [Vallitalea pronyensis]